MGDRQNQIENPVTDHKFTFGVGGYEGWSARYDALFDGEDSFQETRNTCGWLRMADVAFDLFQRRQRRLKRVP